MRLRDGALILALCAMCIASLAALASWQRNVTNVRVAAVRSARAAADRIAAVRDRERRALDEAARRDVVQRRIAARLAQRLLTLRRYTERIRLRALAAIPSINPVDGAIASAYGYRSSPSTEFHRGVDLEADYGTTVHAAAAGVVVSASWDGGFGLKVDIDHGNGYHSWYAHLSRTLVAPGAHVRKGQSIAAVGATGYATGPHLHYQVMRAGTAIDPTPFLAGVPKAIMATLPDPERVQ